MLRTTVQSLSRDSTINTLQYKYNENLLYSGQQPTGHRSKTGDLEVMSSNPGQVKLWVRSTSKSEACLTNH